VGYSLLSGGADFTALTLGGAALLYAQPWQWLTQKVVFEQVWFDSLFVSALRLFFFVQLLPLADDSVRPTTIAVLLTFFVALALTEGTCMRVERVSLLMGFNMVFAQIVIIVSGSLTKRPDGSGKRTIVTVGGAIALSIVAQLCACCYGAGGRLLMHGVLGAFVGATAALMLHLFRRVEDAPVYENLRALEDGGDVNNVVT
jgi:hypothetical protein